MMVNYISHECLNIWYYYTPRFITQSVAYTHSNFFILSSEDILHRQLIVDLIRLAIGGVRANASSMHAESQFSLLKK